MNPMDILASLVKKKMSGPGSVRDTLAGGRRTSTPARHPRARRPTSIQEASRSLEELLGVGREAPSRPGRTEDSSPASRSSPASPSSRTSHSGGNPFDKPMPRGLDEQTKVLIRVMLAAAKADGGLDKTEQAEIFKQLGDVSDQEMDFLRQEFERNVSARDLAWSVPFGMEHAVYKVALLVIRLDEQSEAKFLDELAHGLRIPPARCNEIHAEYGEPIIYDVG
ncbi:MAG: DUF533 domain-containing protein [Planctomycetota bacterium]